MLRNRNPLTFFLSIIVVVSLWLSDPSFAQEPTQTLEEVVVKGEKISRSLQDTVSSVAVFTSTEIDESAIYDIQDVFTRLANVNGASDNQGFTIRGINNSAVGAVGTSGLASFHIDGAFIEGRGIANGQKELWDVGQVEVFRGPQSTNQGRNSLAGAIFVRSKDPTYEPDGQYRVAFGEDNTRALSVAYGNALIDDQLAFRIAIDNQETDGYINNETLGDAEYGGSRNTTVRLKTLFEPTSIDGLSVLTTLSYSDNDSGDIFSSAIDAQGNDIDPLSNRVFANIDAFENVNQSIFTTELDYEINDQWSLTSIFSYNETEFFRRDDDDRQVTGGPSARNREEVTDTISQEVRFNFDSDNLKANIGLYYFNLDNTEDIDDLLGTDSRDIIFQLAQPGLVPLLGTSNATVAATSVAALYDDPFIIDRVGVSAQDIENLAVFANVEYDVSDFVTVFVGARYDDESVINQRTEERGLVSGLPELSDLVLPGGLAPFSSTIAAATIPTINQVILNLNDFDDLDNDADFSAFLPKVGITLNWHDDLSTSFTIQRAYRAGGADSNSVQNFTFDPEFTTNYDFSLRSQWFDNRLTLNANLFYVDWEDQQVNLFDPLDPTALEVIVVNAASSSVKGAELELSYRANNGLDLFANAGYVESEYDDFPLELFSTEGAMVSTFDFSGNEFTDAPNYTFAAGFSYDLSSALRLQSDFNYQEASFDDAQNTRVNDSRTLVNSKLTYQFNDAIELSLVARNLFDEQYLVRSVLPSISTAVVGEPRRVLLQLQGKL